MKKTTFDSDSAQQKAVLMMVDFGFEDLRENLEELKNLATAAGAEVMDALVQKREKVDSRTYIGKGKLEELGELAKFHQANLVIMNHELSGAQLRNLEEALDLKVVDRTALILDIFASRARSNVARLQVELAQMNYSLPRLTGLGRSMSRLAGGIGTRGPGEQKLEIDRRRIKSRISDIRTQLKEIEKERQTQRSQREKNAIPLVALVGYTNAGKSTLLNTILETYETSGQQVFVKDMLFATLDTSTRRIALDKNRIFLLSDTVGFVSHLPHLLVEAFKATLEEVVLADLLIHVVDGTDDRAEYQRTITQQVLEEIGVWETPQVLVYNKMDLRTEPLYGASDHLEISAAKGTGIGVLMDTITGLIFADLRKETFLIPYDQGHVLSELMNRGESAEIEYLDTGTRITVVVDEVLRNRYGDYRIEGY
ncbi:MAG: hypothetical protein AVO33_00635 [delta proteobacterium ML8_F1]|nr:MAG: hypothetical protein AVO33_00635 [delta proteobacterium ML8_F1]